MRVQPNVYCFFLKFQVFLPWSWTKGRASASKVDAMDLAARAGDLARIQVLRRNGHEWGDAHHIAAVSGHYHILEWMYSNALVVRRREDTVPEVMRLLLRERDEWQRHRLALCVKIILDRGQSKSEIVKVSVYTLDHPNAIPIKNRTCM